VISQRILCQQGIQDPSNAHGSNTKRHHDKGKGRISAIRNSSPLSEENPNETSVDGNKGIIPSVFTTFGM
jgi:hypothetical protein